ncbi:MAG: HU family DNA-binding protein [Planctomycetota bacterium]
MTRLGKRQLIQLLSERSDLSKAAVGELLGLFQAVVSEQLAKGDSVTLPGFGSWRMQVRAPRVTRSVRDGKKIAIPPRTRVAFRAGAGLKRAAESSIDPRVYFGDGAAAQDELDTVFANLFGDSDPNLGRDEVRQRIHDAVGSDAEREAVDFFAALWEWQTDSARKQDVLAGGSGDEADAPAARDVAAEDLAAEDREAEDPVVEDSKRATTDPTDEGKLPERVPGSGRV